MQKILIQLANLISTHALTWSATDGIMIATKPQGVFQLTRSRGARRITADPSITADPFQLTRSRGARPGEKGGDLLMAGDFNSRAHVERDFKM